MKLGVCYYPEHWPEAWWDEDARAMVAMGLSVVRIGEFAWSRIEPEPGAFDWGWLDRALDVLHRHGLQVVLGTPTATPPKWLVDADPSMLAVDHHGHVRGFGSRRHYCFSSESYRDQCARIVTALADRYGNHPAVVAWQTDNEFGCHATTFSYSANAVRRFRRWLAAHYGDIAALNSAWGNVFWSQEYRGFDEIDAPKLTVTEANPAHRLDYQRFASDEVASFNRLQVEILRERSPGRDIIHNFMGFVTDFDHHDVAADLDVASWDSYPLGFTEQFWFDEDCKARYLRQGHPDIAGFHHDLYCGVGRGRWWVMEQQPGPVNWARSNPAPLPGMVRAWSWEAFAHGAEVVSYFRWRQLPFGQEAMHAGLTLPDRSTDVGGIEAAQVAREIAQLGALPASTRAEVALVFGYPSVWMSEIQPQGRDLSALRAAFEMYTALRRLGLDVDIVSPEAELTGYRLIALPMLLDADAALAAKLAASGAQVLVGPRSGSKTRDFQIPPSLAPGALQALLPLAVTRVESLRHGASVGVSIDGVAHHVTRWREWLRTDLTPRARFTDGGGAWFSHGKAHYLAGWPEPAMLRTVLRALTEAAGITTTDMADGVRWRRRGGLCLAINYAAEQRPTHAPAGAKFVIGGPDLPPAGIAAWRQA